MKTVVLFTLLFFTISAFAQDSTGASVNALTVDERGKAFLVKHCNAISNYHWDNAALNADIEKAGKKHRHAKAMFITGSIFTAIGVGGIIAGVVYKTPAQVNANTGKWDFTKTLLLAGGTTVVGISLPLHFSGTILQIKSRSMARKICRQF
jgi:hypothetical protein